MTKQTENKSLKIQQRAETDKRSHRDAELFSKLPTEDRYPGLITYYDDPELAFLNQTDSEMSAVEGVGLAGPAPAKDQYEAHMVANVGDIDEIHQRVNDAFASKSG